MYKQCLALSICEDYKARNVVTHVLVNVLAFSLSREINVHRCCDNTRLVVTAANHHQLLGVVTACSPRLWTVNNGDWSRGGVGLASCRRNMLSVTLFVHPEYPPPEVKMSAEGEQNKNILAPGCRVSCSLLFCFIVRRSPLARSAPGSSVPQRLRVLRF